MVQWAGAIGSRWGFVAISMGWMDETTTQHGNRHELEKRGRISSRFSRPTDGGRQLLFIPLVLAPALRAGRQSIVLYVYESPWRRACTTRASRVPTCCAARQPRGGVFRQGSVDLKGS